VAQHARRLGRRSPRDPWSDWHVRRTVVAYRLKALAAGHDPGGAFLLLHHLTWLGVLLVPGTTLATRPGQPSATSMFVQLGGDPALAAVYAVLALLCLIAVTRLTLSTTITRTCLLLVLSLSVTLAVVYLAGNPLSLIAWDAIGRALLAWWAYSSMDEDG
jgi:hypothetical protein